MANAAPSSTSGTAVHQNVVPSEVGWQFVPQYYTFVNKQPHRLHCFYTKNSTFIHGTEGEDGRPCYGQHEIHSKILSIGFQDCKVFIHSVDAQASAAGGIIIQVIGEMSNRGEAWRKFVQTFFLAEQPNGYFVLNDIFRFLKEESVEDEEASEEAELEAEPALAAQPVEHHQPEPEPAPPVNIPAPAPVEVAPEPVAEVVPEVAPPAPVAEPSKPQPNGLHPAEPEKQPEPIVEVPAPVEPEPEPEREPTPEPQREPTPPPPAPAPVAVQPSPPPTPAPAVQPTPPPPAQPSAPPAPKTWANLAAANSKKWGAAVAQESRGMSVEAATPSPPPSGAQTPVSGHHTGPPAGAGRGAHHGPKGPGHPAYQQAMAVTTPHVFVKGVVDPLTDPQLNKALSEYGTIKEIEIVRNKACAFVEYTALDAAKRAIVASLPVSQGGDGGIRIDAGTEQPVRISIETKKERGDRPPPRGPRGGAPPGQGTNDRGGFRGRGRGRGVPSGKAM